MVRCIHHYHYRYLVEVLMIYVVKFVDVLADLGGIQDLILVRRAGTVEVEVSYIVLPVVVEDEVEVSYICLPVVVKDQIVYAAPLNDHLRI